MKKSKILITGAFGFIGSHLVEYLVKKNCNVIAFDRYNSNNDYGWLNNSEFLNDIEFVLGDIRDYDSVNNILKNCNSCIHLAALIGIPYSYISPLAYIRTNIEGTYNILESAKVHNIEQLVVTSTSETYGSLQYEPIDEKHPLVGQSPYSASKIAADQLAISYYRSFNLPIKIIRPFNVYGPRQSTRAIIPTIVSQILNNKKIIKLGNVETKRDFTFVHDTCSAYWELLNCDNIFGEIFNVGTNKNISINELFNLIKIKLDSKSSLEQIDLRKRNKLSEVANLLCDNSKILNKTSWRQKVDFSDGLDLTIEWIKKNIDHYKTETYHV